jgi:urease accessory protein
LTDVIRVAARRSPGGTIVPELRGSVPWRPHLVPSSRASAAVRAATVVLVQTGACLVAGDDVRLEIEVGAGARLALRELGATIAHHVRAGSAARLTIEVVLEPDAVLVWAAAPLISARGSELVRSLRVTLAPGAVALLRETTVFGRADEPAGALDSRLDATAAGDALLHERLVTGDASLARSPVMMGDARVLDSVLLLGRRDHGRSTDVMDLAGPGSVWRGLNSDTAAVITAGDQVWARWQAMIDSVDQMVA